MRVALGFLLGTVLNRFSTQGRRLLRRSAPRNDKPSVIASAAKRSPHSRRLPRPCGPRNRGDCFGPAALAMTGGAAGLAMTAYGHCEPRRGVAISSNPILLRALRRSIFQWQSCGNPRYVLRQQRLVDSENRRPAAICGPTKLRRGWEI